MRLALWLRLALGFLLASTVLAAHARVAENTLQEKFGFENTDCICVCALLAHTEPREVALFLGASVSGASNLRMPGQTYDSETGTFQNYFRDYDPLTGRYRQLDPIGLDGGSNRQIYSDANPLIKSDPTGLFPDSVTAACRTNPILCAEINGPKPVPIPVPIPITKKGDLEACEKDADDQLDRDYAYCKALGATYNDYRTRKACEEKAIAKYVARLKQCKKECK
jgi:RHS repeat-associated protein